MVESQLRPSKVTAPSVLAAFQAVRREAFVPEALRAAAYADEDVPIGGGRYLLEPLVLARLIQAADIARTDRALEIGGGTGYGAAILARLVDKVVALESDPTLSERAKRLLGAEQAPGVTVVTGPLEAGYPAGGPFDVILISGAIGTVPTRLTDQLNEGGRLVAVLKSGPGQVGQAILIERSAGTLSRRVLFDAGVHALPGFAPGPAFVF